MSAAGSGGGAAQAIADLSNVIAQRFEQANALHGVTFAPDGKVYAAGELNVLDESKATGDTTADKYKSSIVGHKLVATRFDADARPDESFGDQDFVTWQEMQGPRLRASVRSSYRWARSVQPADRSVRFTCAQVNCDESLNMMTKVSCDYVLDVSSGSQSVRMHVPDV